MKKYSIVFDNKCAVCNTSVKTFQKLGFLESIQAIELDKFRENNLACNVNPVRACNEMAVINNESLEVSYGYDGYVNLLGVRFKRLSKFMSVKTIRALLNPFYHFIASNRRVIAPIKGSESTCIPTLRKGYRFLFLLMVSFYSIAITYLKGELLSEYNGLNFLSGERLILTTGLGWIFVGLFYKKANKWEYWGHLAMIACFGVLIQSFTLLGFYFFQNFLWIFVGIALSDLFMLWMHYNRMKIIQENQIQTLIWWVSLHFIAGVQIVFYSNTI